MADGINIDIEMSGADAVGTTFATAIESASGEPHWVVGTNVEYAVYLEQGTSKMPPYPFMKPAIEYVMANEAGGIADSADSVDAVVGGIAMAIERRAKHYASSGVSPGPDVDTGTLKASIRAQKVR